jgi:ribulose-phosphate 3-epimerase
MIIPAVMPINFEDLNDKLRMLAGLSSWVQIDIMDGRFVPSVSWPYDEKHSQSFDSIVKEEDGLPFWKDLFFEVDLMILEPEKELDKWIRSGCSRIIIHMNSSQDVEKCLRSCKESGVEVCLAVTPGTSQEMIEPYVDIIDAIQFMGIRKIGFQGQPFETAILGEVSSFKTRFDHLPISVDGGVSLELAPDIISAGADRLVSGSAIFESGDVKKAIEKFTSLIEAHGKSV